MITSHGQTLVSINMIPTKINYNFLKKWFILHLGQVKYKISSCYVVPQAWKCSTTYYWDLKRTNSNAARTLLHPHDINKSYFYLLPISLTCIRINTGVQNIPIFISTHTWKTAPFQYTLTCQCYWTFYPWATNIHLYNVKFCF